MDLAVTDTGGRPFSFPREPRPVPPADMVRVPAFGELSGLMEAFFPLIQARYPRALRMPLQVLFRHAATGPQNPPMRLLHTKNAVGFALAERDALEPEWTVRVKFVVGAPDEAELVRAALHDWAKTIGAINFDDAPVAAGTPERPAAVNRSAKRRTRKAKGRHTPARRRAVAAPQLLADQSDHEPEGQVPSS